MKKKTGGRGGGRSKGCTNEKLLFKVEDIGL